MIFDPFGDYETLGYLRNVDGLKDREIIKIQEHLFLLQTSKILLTTFRLGIHQKSPISHSLKYTGFYSASSIHGPEWIDMHLV